MQKPSTTSDVTPRRKFFRYLLSEAIGLAEELRGKPQMRLNDLEHVPDELMRQMVPVLNETRFYKIETDWLLLRPQKNTRTQKFCRLDEQQRFTVNYFDGRHNLEEIGDAVAKHFEQGQEIAYQQSKALFLFLAKHAICFPLHAHDD